jgi:hypothetical protein
MASWNAIHAQATNQLPSSCNHSRNAALVPIPWAPNSPNKRNRDENAAGETEDSENHRRNETAIIPVRLSAGAGLEFALG